MFTKILVPVDGSDSSNRALEKAIELGRVFSSEIVVFSVAPESHIMKYTTTVSEQNEKLNEDSYNTTKEILDLSMEKLITYPYSYDTDYSVGDPSSEIIEYANNNNIDLIVMGNRDLGMFSRTFLGSVSTHVINHSDVSVLVVKDW